MTFEQRKMLLILNSKKAENYYTSHPFNILIHSVLNTISLTKLIRVYIDNELKELKDSIFSNIKNRLSSFDKVEEIYEELKYILQNTMDYYKSQRIRKVLEVSILYLDKVYKSDFFNTFFYSKYLNDKKSAIPFFEFLTVPVTNDLLNEYTNSKDITYLKPLIKEEYTEFICVNISKIWDVNLPFYLKKQIIELLYINKFQYLVFLKTTEPDLFLLASILKGEIGTKEILELLSNVSEDKQYFSLLHASRKIDFENIKDIIEKYLSWSAD